MARPALILALLVLAALPAAAQRWPAEAGPGGDSDRRAIQQLERRPATSPPSVTETRPRPLGGLRDWLGRRRDSLGRNDRSAAPGFEAQRARENDWNRRLSR